MKAGDTVSIIPSVAGGVDRDAAVPEPVPARRRDGLAERDCRAHQRRDQALQPAPDHAGGRHRRSAEAEGGEGAVHRRGRPRIAGGDVSRRGRRRHARHRRLRRRRLQQPAAADSARHARRRAVEAGVGEGSAERDQPECQDRDATRRRSRRENALELFAPYDVIVDGTDNFPTRYLVNDACVLLGKPNAYGSIFRFEGQASVFATKDGPCYRCLYPEPPPPGLVPSCAEGGVLGVLPGDHRHAFRRPRRSS